MRCYRITQVGRTKHERNTKSRRNTVAFFVCLQYIVERLKALIDVKERDELTIPITQEHIDKIKKYLLMLDLLVPCEERYETGRPSEHIVLAQPGMRYSIAKALVYSLMQDEYFASRSESDKAHIVEKILEDVKGRMMEDIILLETAKAAPRTMLVFKFKFDSGGEYDRVLYDRNTDTCRLYEVKHSDKIVDRQTRFLRDEGKLSLVSRRFGKIAGRYVIYRGPTQAVGDIQYVNAEEYLTALGQG